MTIPKIIHQTYFSRNLPGGLQDNVDGLKLRNPEWEYRFYDDDAILQFIQGKYDADMLKAYNRISPKYGAAKADLFRYLLLYKCGGVYLDIKSSAAKPLDEVFRPDDNFLISSWDNLPGERFEGWGLHAAVKNVPGGEFQQWYIAAEPGHPFLAAVIKKVLHNIDKYHPSIHGTGKAGVLWLTGPIAYTLSIAPLLPHHSHRRVNSSHDLGLNYSVYNDLTHKTILRSHYTNQTEPVVLIGVGKRLTVNMINLVKEIRDLVNRHKDKLNL